MNSSNLDTERLNTIGYDSCMTNCGNFLIMDQNIVEYANKIDGLSVLPLKEAMDIYPHIEKELLFGIVPKDKNEYTKLASQREPVGYYIRVEPGIRIEEPMQAAFMLGIDDSTQVIHNIVELCDGAGLNIVNGCTTSGHHITGRHIGITETYLHRGSNLGYTMIHNWGSGVEVFPVGASVVGEDASLISNYVAMTSIKRIETYPVATVHKKGNARFYSIIFAKGNSYFDSGAKLVLKGADSSGEIISRVVSDGGTVISRQMLCGNVAGSVGHMECSGLLLGNKGIIHSIPELRGEDPDVNLSHEAAVGKISRDELNYLMTRGLSEEQARSLIIRGFLDIKIEGLPDKVQALVDDVIERSVQGSI